MFLLRKFRQDDCGAVTVDWVVLSATVIGLAILGYVTIRDAAGGYAGDVETSMSSAVVVVAVP